MANETIRIHHGCIVPQTVDTEVTENGEYPVQGKGIYQALSGATPGPATTETAGVVKMATNVPEAEGEAPTASEFKALLDALIEAGIMAEPEPEPEPEGDPEGDPEAGSEGE